MTTMKMLTLAAATALMAASAPAMAGTQQQTTQQGQVQRTDLRTQNATVEAQKVLYVCEATEATARSFRREYGERPQFMTAEQVLEARNTSQNWDTPRCMTKQEHARLNQALSIRAGGR